MRANCAQVCPPAQQSALSKQSLGTCAVAVLSFTERLAGVFHGQPDSFTGNLETADTAVSREMVAAVRHHQSQLGLPPFPKPIGGVCTARAAPPQRMKFATDCRGCACVAADESAKQTWTTAFRSGLVAQLHAPPPPGASERASA